MTQPISIAILAHPPVNAQPAPSRKHRWERLWNQALDKVTPHDVMFSVIALIQVGKDESWGRKLPKPGKLWETPRRHIAGNERRAAVLRTRSLMSWEQFHSLRVETRARAQDLMELDDPTSEFKDEDYLSTPGLAARALHLYYEGDPAGAYYGRYFAVPFRPVWLSAGCGSGNTLLCQSLLAEELREEFGKHD